MIGLAGTALETGQWLAELLEKESDDILVIVLRATLVLVVGLVAARLLGGLAGRIAARRGSAQGQMMTRRFVFYGVICVTGFMLLDTLGVDVSVLLGAAGILTVALGFASQTSASNLISGLFLLGERPFVVGDVITVGGRTGEVLSVDLLSVKLRTFDNLFVRVPNETLIKSEIVNITRNPIRRIDVELRLAYGQDLDAIGRILRGLVDDEPEILAEPEPVFWIDKLGDSAVHVRFLVWASNRHQFFDVRSRVYELVAGALQEHRIQVGYQRVEVEGGDAGPRTIAAVESAVVRTPAAPPPGPRA